MSYAKVTAMVFPMVVNPKSAPKDNNKYHRVMMSGDSPRDSDVDSLNDSIHRPSAIRHEVEGSLAGTKLNKGSQTDIMLIPPLYPAPPPPNQPPRVSSHDKRKVRVQHDFQGDKKNESNGPDKVQCSTKTDDTNQMDQMENDIGERRLSRCEHCSHIVGSSLILDATPVENEPAAEVETAASPSAVQSERDRDQQQPSEDSCAMECLYYAVQCSDCTLL